MDIHFIELQMMTHESDAGKNSGVLCRRLALLKMLSFFSQKVTNKFSLNKYLERNILLHFLRFPSLEKNTHKFSIQKKNAA